MGLLQEALPASTLVVAIDPGKVSNRVWLSTGEAGEVAPPVSLPVLRPGLEQLHRLVVDHTGDRSPVFAIEATGGLHQAWMRELNQRFPGSVRLFAAPRSRCVRSCQLHRRAPGQGVHRVVRVWPAERRRRGTRGRRRALGCYRRAVLELR